MAIAVIFPKVSLETDSGTIARWLKEDGSQVEQGEALFEIDNDKAAVEVEATASGVIAHLRKEGDEVQVGEAVARILAPGEKNQEARDTPAPGGPPPVEPPAPSHKAGVLPARSTSRIVATPLAKRIAAQRQIDLRAITGSGPGGRIQKRDVADLPAGARKAAPTIQGAQLNAVWLQKEGGSTVVALHGFASDRNAWRSLLAAGRSKARVLAVDLPGHGASPRYIPADLDGISEMVEQRLAREGVDEAVMVGHSFGAAVAARVASRAMAKIDALMLISPAGLGPEIRREFLRGFVAAKEPASIRPWLQELVFDREAISEAFVRAVAAQRKDEGLSHALEAFAARYFRDGTQTFSIRADLERIRVPARIVFGTQDRIIPFAHCHSLPGRVGLHAIRECGHLPYMEQAELCLSLVNEMVALARAER